MPKPSACNSTGHSFTGLDISQRVTSRSPGADVYITPKYLLYCQKCGEIRSVKEES